MPITNWLSKLATAFAPMAVLLVTAPNSPTLAFAPRVVLFAPRATEFAPKAVLLFPESAIAEEPTAVVNSFRAWEFAPSAVTPPAPPTVPLACALKPKAVAFGLFAWAVRPRPWLVYRRPASYARRQGLLGWRMRFPGYQPDQARKRQPLGR